MPKKTKIIPDKDNLAIHIAALQGLQPGRAVLFSSDEIARIADGIRSLVAERDALNKIKESIQTLDGERLYEIAAWKDYAGQVIDFEDTARAIKAWLGKKI